MVFRLYNPHTGEHFYTVSIDERNNLRNAGWNFESIGWTEADFDSSPVFRVYNPNSGLHFYTPSVYERDSLVRSGWRDEGVAFYQAGSTPVYRAYNPYNGQHNWTVSQYEQNSLVAAGWRDEGVTFAAFASSPYFQGKLDSGVGNMTCYVDPSASWVNASTAASNWMYAPWGNPIYLYQQNSSSGATIGNYGTGTLLSNTTYAQTWDYNSTGGAVATNGYPPTSNYHFTLIFYNNSKSGTQVVANGTIARHEMGHVFGLAHIYSDIYNPSIMRAAFGDNDNFAIDRTANDNVSIHY